MISISVCMIVRNEEPVLERCLLGLRDIADELIVVDTGSTDKTKAVASRFTGRLYDFDWKDNFADARNFSFSKATKDYLYTADADEVLDEENRKKFLQLKASLSTDVDIVEMRYANQLECGSTYNFDVEYRPKLFKRLRSFHWVYPIHEIVDGGVRQIKSDIVVIHKPLSRHSRRDFAVFTKLTGGCRILPLHLHRLYARELYIAGTEEDFLVACPYFESTLHEESLGAEDVRLSECIVARASRLKGDDALFFKTALKNAVGQPCAEICCELGDYYFRKEDYEEAAIWYYTAAYGSQSELNIRCSGDIPLRRLSECYSCMGIPEESEKYKAEAGNWKAPSLITP